MGIEINKDGYLLLERAGEMKAVNCPYIASTRFPRCGDHCAKFREIHSAELKHIDCCGTVHSCDAKDFTDGRAL